MAEEKSKVPVKTEPTSAPAVIGEGAAGSVPKEQRIAEMAYFRAEVRGFEPGGELDDWLAAEAEFEAMAREGSESSPSMGAAA